MQIQFETVVMIYNKSLHRSNTNLLIKFLISTVFVYVSCNVMSELGFFSFYNVDTKVRYKMDNSELNMKKAEFIRHSNINHIPM